MLEFLHPAGLPEVEVYRQMSISSKGRMVFLAGQVSVDATGDLVGPGDLAAQVAQCYRNVATALSAVGGSLDDIADLTVFVPHWSPGQMPQLLEGIQRAATEFGIALVAPATLIGVDALDVPEHLVELKVIAVVD